MPDVVFAGTEMSAFGEIAGTLVETTSATYYRAAYSRSAPNSTATGRKQRSAKLTTALSSCRIKFQVQPAYADSDGDTFWWVAYADDNTPLFRMRVQTNGSVYTLQGYVGATWTTIAALGNLTTTFANLINEIEIAFVGGAGGSIEMYVEGVEIVSNTAVAFDGDDYSYMDLGTADDAAPFSASEMVVSAAMNSLIGYAVETEGPTADGLDSTDGTGTYADVDEAIVNDADYIELTTDEKRSFTFPARTGLLNTCQGVGVAARLKCDVTGPQAARFYLVLDVSGTPTRFYSPAFALTNGWLPYQYVWALDPRTTAAWVPADAALASLEGGVEALASV